MKVRELIDNPIDHNALVKLWVTCYDNCSFGNNDWYRKWVWKGMMWELDGKHHDNLDADYNYDESNYYGNCEVDKVISIVPESIGEADYININIKGVSYEEALVKKEAMSWETDNTIPNITPNDVPNNNDYCANRLPCGICTLTNQTCQKQGGTWKIDWNNPNITCEAK